MDGELRQAAISGDVEFLIKAFATKPTNYFLKYFTPADNKNDLFKGNIFHIAMLAYKVEFMRKALEILPIEASQILFSQPDVHGWNPLHVMGTSTYDMESKEYMELVGLILSFYNSQPRLHENDKNKPWLALNHDKQTPLHVATWKLRPHHDLNEEYWAMEILAMDMELLCGIEDWEGGSPLFLAVQTGYSRVAEKILMSSSSYSLSGQNGSTPLHFAPKCSENVLRLLLEKHLDLLDLVDDQGLNVLHQWAEIGEVWALEFLLEGKYPTARTKVFKDLIWQTTKKILNCNPLHKAAMDKNRTEVAKVLIQGYQQETRAGEMQPEPTDRAPWRMKDNLGNTCLHTALYANHEDLALHLLSLDLTFLCQTYNNKGTSAFLAAVSMGCGQFVEEILRTQEISFSMLRCNDGSTVLHNLQYIPENIGRKLLGKFWWTNNLKDNNGKTALDIAKDAGIPWLVNLLMNPSSIQKEPFDWIAACKREETEAVLAFIDNCHDLLTVCREKNDTPLHHIKMQTYKEYLNFLKLPSIAELKNTTDFDGATPLHRALERKDMLLAKALLIDNGIERNIDDYHGITAMDLLAELCKENDDWAKMCKQIKVNPYLKTTYIQPGTNMDQMRNTLSVVAALLATITFAAGFTLPGGLNNDTGNAVLAKKAAFLVFLLSDAYAMCTSMLVLFCLIWSMVSTRDMSYLLVDRSVWILMQALYGTMVAFMTGVYVVIAHNSLWAAIIIFVMCSLIGISANRTILHNVLAKFIPATNQDREDRCRMLEEGTSSGYRKANIQNSTSYVGEESLISTRNQEQGDQNPLLEEETTFTLGNVQNSTSFAGIEMSTSERYQDRIDQAQLLQKGGASTSHMMTHGMSSKNVAFDFRNQTVTDGEGMK